MLNDQNLADYIRLPDYIEKKKDAGQIPMAGYADLMRFALLEHYGGTWIDSTVYLTDPIPDMILNSDFFAVRNSLLLIDNPVLYPAWFLHAKKGNKTIREIRNVRNPQSIKDAMPGVDYIFHAAALKQVPSCEFFPMQAVQTNIIGTDNVLHAAIDAGVKRVVCLSTDKAAYDLIYTNSVVRTNANVGKGDFILAGIDGDHLLQAVDVAIEMNKNRDLGIPVPDYVDENVSDKVVKIIQSYTGVIDKMVWRKY